MFERKYLKIAIAAAALTLCVVLGIVFLKAKNTSSPSPTPSKNFLGNTPGNIINNGLVAAEKDYIYYSNTLDKNKLYTMKENGSEKKKISDDPCMFINVLDGWIYYQNTSDGGKIYRIKKDGTMRECLNNDNSTFITVDGDYIYYCDNSNGGSITRIKNNGSGKKVICRDSAEFINVSNGWIYYSNTNENYSMYKVNTDGQKRTLLSKNMCYFLNVSGDWIYYSNYSDGFKLSKIKTSGHGNKVINNISSQNINVCGNWIYFCSSDMKYGGAGIYRIKIDGSSKENVCTEDAQNLNTSSDWLFFSNAFDKNLLYKVKTDGSMKQSNDGTTVVRTIYDLNNALLSHVPYEIKDEMLTKAYEKATELVKELIKPGMTDLEKELVLHNYVVTHSKYDIDNYEKNKLTSDAYSSYGILVKGEGVCAGYAESLQLLLNLSNVECRLVYGIAGKPGDTGNHAWNMVKIDGQYYHLDATWDDPIPDMGNFVSVQYFNVSDSFIKKDHTWEKNNNYSCTSDRFSYFRTMYYPVYKDGWIYYCNAHDKYKLYKIRIDGSQKTKLCNDAVEYIIIYNDNLYYSNYSDGAFLYRIDFNGKGKARLNDEYTQLVSIENGILKFRTEGGQLKTFTIK